MVIFFLQHTLYVSIKNIEESLNCDDIRITTTKIASPESKAL